MKTTYHTIKLGPGWTIAEIIREPQPASYRYRLSIDGLGIDFFDDLEQAVKCGIGRAKFVRESRRISNLGR